MISKKIFSAILVSTLLTSISVQCTGGNVDYKKHMLITGYSFLGLYTALKSLQSAASSFIMLDYQLDHNINNASFVAKHMLNAARITFFGLASFFSLKQALKLSKTSTEESKEKR